MFWGIDVGFQTCSLPGPRSRTKTQTVCLSCQEARALKRALLLSAQSQNAEENRHDRHGEHYLTQSKSWSGETHE